MGGAVKQGSHEAELERDMRELLAVMRPVIAAIKHSGGPPPMLEAALAQGTLGPRHSGVLVTLTLEGEMSVSELSRRLGLSLSTTSMMVGELSRAGFVERAEDERDRRRTLVRLNEHHRRALTEWLGERLAPLRRALERMEPAARRSFIDGWRILGEETAALPADAECPASDSVSPRGDTAGLTG